MKLVSINPSKNNEILGEVEETTKEEILEKIKIARLVQKNWRDLDLKKRIDIVKNLYETFENNIDKIANLISLEMGMPITQSKEEVESGLNYLNWYLNNAEKHLAPEVTFETETEIHKVFYEPKGLVVSITPWNYPFSNLVWQSFQNLIVGNVVINKPDQNTPPVYKLIEELISKSGLPKGVQQFVFGGKEVGQFLVEQDIDMICFTGSTKTGEHLYKVAASKMIPILMELGGSAPGIVLRDADVDNIIDSIYFNRFMNAGQICDGLKRLIVHESKYEEVVDELKKVLEKQVIGEAINPETTIGPLVSEKQLETLINQFNDA